MNEIAIKQISSLEPFKRYQYFIKRIADTEELWILVNENQDLAHASISNEIVVPIWSAKEFAIPCIGNIYKDYQTKKITLDLVEPIIFSFVRIKKALLDIFPVGNNSGFVVSIEEFLRDLKEELKKYE